MAWEMANADPDDPDPTPGGEAWQGPVLDHSLAQARQQTRWLGVTWEAAGVDSGRDRHLLGLARSVSCLKEMQRHYEGLSVRARMQQARITGGM